MASRCSTQEAQTRKKITFPASSPFCCLWNATSFPSSWEGVISHLSPGTNGAPLPTLAQSWCLKPVWVSTVCTILCMCLGAGTCGAGGGLQTLKLLNEPDPLQTTHAPPHLGIPPHLDNGPSPPDPPYPQHTFTIHCALLGWHGALLCTSRWGTEREHQLSGMRGHTARKVETWLFRSLLTGTNVSAIMTAMALGGQV